MLKDFNMRNAFRIVAINLGLILVGLLLVEAIIGNWVFGPSYGFLNIPRNAKRHFDVSGLYPGGSLVTYSRDENGLRGTYGSPAEIDVLVLGGSTANELYVSDGETWVDRLRQGFARDGAPLTIVNASIDGQSTRGHIRNFDVWFPNIPDLNPRYLIAYIGINDAVLGDQQQIKYDDMVSPELSRRVRHYIMNNSVVYNLFRRVRGLFVARRTRLVHGSMNTRTAQWMPVAEPAEGTATDETMVRRLEAYHTRAETLARRIRDFGAEPIFVTQARGDYKRIDGRLFVLREEGTGPPEAMSHKVLELYNLVTLEVCSKLEMVCVDLGSDLAFEDGDFYDYVHTTPSGSRRIGDFLYSRLKDTLGNTKDR